MDKGRPSSFVVFLCAALLSVPAAKVFGGSAAMQGENEGVVYLGTTACGVERWYIKVGLDQGAASIPTATVVQTNIYHLRSLPRPSSLDPYHRITPTETTMFAVSAKLLRVKEEADSDYHLVLADSGGRTMIAEIPAPACAIGSGFLSYLKSVRRTFDARYRVSTS